MLFTSAEFIFFILLLVPIYYAVAHRFRWILLLLASYVFYMNWTFRFVPFLFICTLVNYLAGILVERDYSQRFKRIVLTISTLISLSFLAFFKYYIEFVTNLGKLLNIETSEFIPANILIPVGISFYTFQAIGYPLDVYWKRRPAEKHFGFFALFIAYFPQLLSGPLEVSTKLLPRLRMPVTTTYTQALHGLIQMLFGFAKKMIIADNLLPIHQFIFGPDLTIHSGQTLLFSMLLISLVYYFDFSGYCDIALGLSKILGIELTTNFNLPYLALSVKEVWQRWHITISYWIKHYPLHFLRSLPYFKNKWYLVSLIGFMLLGAWHGPSLNYFFFGFFHGLVWITDKYSETIFEKYKSKKWWKLTYPIFYFKMVFCFLFVGFFLVCGNMERAKIIYSKVFLPSEYSFTNPFTRLYELGLNYDFNFFLVIVSFMFLFMIAETIVITKEIKWPQWTKWGAVYCCLIFIAVLGSFASREFIYYRY